MTNFILVLLVILLIFLVLKIVMLVIEVDFVIELLEGVFVILLGLDSHVELVYALTIVQALMDYVMLLQENVIVMKDLKDMIVLSFRVLEIVLLLLIILVFVTLPQENAHVHQDGKENFAQ